MFHIHSEIANNVRGSTMWQLLVFPFINEIASAHSVFNCMTQFSLKEKIR